MKIELVVMPYGLFGIVEVDDFGNRRIVYQDTDMAQCLRRTSEMLGKPLLIPIVLAEQF